MNEFCLTTFNVIQACQSNSDAFTFANWNTSKYYIVDNANNN